MIEKYGSYNLMEVLEIFGINGFLGFYLWDFMDLLGFFRSSSQTVGQRAFYFWVI